MYKYSIKKTSEWICTESQKTVEVPEVSVCCGRTVSTGRVRQVCMSLTSFYKFRWILNCKRWTELIHSLIHYYGLLGMGSML